MTVEIRDYNGEGRWGGEEIIRRYREYAGRMSVQPVRDMSLRIHEQGCVRWVSPVMAQVIDGIEAGDVACAQIGVEFIEEDRGFVFGAILKSNTARALRRFPGLTAEQITRIRMRVVSMLATGIVPREYRHYRKLLRKVGVGDYWPRIEAAVPKNRYAAESIRYFRETCG